MDFGITHAIIQYTHIIDFHVAYKWSGLLKKWVWYAFTPKPLNRFRLNLGQRYDTLKLRVEHKLLLITNIQAINDIHAVEVAGSN